MATFMHMSHGRVAAGVLVATLVASPVCGGASARPAGDAKPGKGQAGTAGKPAKPTDATAAKTAKFPGPVVDKLMKGWDGVAWGATLDEFKKKYPGAKQAAGGRWVTGLGDSDLAGQPVTAEYGFSKKGQLALIRFEPPAANRRTFTRGLAEAGVVKDGPRPGWSNNGVSFVLAELNGEQFAVALNARFTDPVEKKSPK